MVEEQEEKETITVNVLTSLSLSCRGGLKLMEYRLRVPLNLNQEIVNRNRQRRHIPWTLAMNKKRLSGSRMRRTRRLRPLNRRRNHPDL